MKIGIYTHHLHVNYGGILQAYALQHYLQTKGHNVWIIHHSNYHSKMMLFLLNVKRTLDKFIFSKNIKPFIEQDQLFTDKYIDLFKDKYLKPHTRDFSKFGYNKIEEYNFDAVIVGSDQVWRFDYVKKELYHYFLDFVPNTTKKIAYAASFGLSTWQFSDEQTKSIRKYLEKFISISVREDSGVPLIKEHLDLNAVHVIDPTMLLSIDNYSLLIKNCKNRTLIFDGNIFTYILDQNKDKQNIISKVESILGGKSFSVLNSNYYNYKYKKEDRVLPPIEDWLNGIESADYVITDSFHGCVFSILFNKPFLVYANKERGLARFSSLLKMFDLEDRIIFNEDDSIKTKLESNIDWDRVNKILDNQRLVAFDFIEKSLN